MAGSPTKSAVSPGKGTSGTELNERIDLVEGAMTGRMESLEEREGAMAGQLKALEKRLRSVENLSTPLLSVEEEMSSTKWATLEVLEGNSEKLRQEVSEDVKKAVQKLERAGADVTHKTKETFGKVQDIALAGEAGATLPHPPHFTHPVAPPATTKPSLGRARQRTPQPRRA